MELDRTHIVIRKRMQTEIADLALVAIRRYPWAMLVGFTLGALPWAVANLFLLGWIPLRESAFGFGDEDAAVELMRYLSWMTVLVVAQTPAAGAMTTYYLGQAVFEKRPTWANVRRELRKQAGAWFWHLGMLRLAIPLMVLMAIRWGSPQDPLIDLFGAIFVMVVLVIVRSSRPFMPEILLLEQCPRRSTDPSVVTRSRRSAALHRPMAGELSSRFMTVSFASMFGTLAIYYTLHSLRGLLFGQWGTDMFSLLVFFPLALWIVGGITVYFRLLSYLDTRIRLEGWEVELAVRAEEIRQFGTEGRFRETKGGTGESQIASVVAEIA